MTNVAGALDPGMKVSASRTKGNVETIDIITAKGDEFTLTLDATTHRKRRGDFRVPKYNVDGDVGDCQCLNPKRMES